MNINKIPLNILMAVVCEACRLDIQLQLIKRASQLKVCVECEKKLKPKERK